MLRDTAAENVALVGRLSPSAQRTLMRRPSLWPALASNTNHIEDDVLERLVKTRFPGEVQAKLVARRLPTHLARYVAATTQRPAVLGAFLRHNEVGADQVETLLRRKGFTKEAPLLLLGKDLPADLLVKVALRVPGSARIDWALTNDLDDAQVGELVSASLNDLEPWVLTELLESHPGAARSFLGAPGALAASRHLTPQLTEELVERFKTDPTGTTGGVLVALALNPWVPLSMLSDLEEVFKEAVRTHPTGPVISYGNALKSALEFRLAEGLWVEGPLEAAPAEQLERLATRTRFAKQQFTCSADVERRWEWVTLLTHPGLDPQVRDHAIEGLQLDRLTKRSRTILAKVTRELGMTRPAKPVRQPRLGLRPIATEDDPARTLVGQGHQSWLAANWVADQLKEAPEEVWEAFWSICDQFEGTLGELTETAKAL